MIKIRSVELETVCGVSSTFPDTSRFEVAFAGKSNVGKSSLINAMVNRKSLARTSSQPGKTQTVNYYRVNKDTPAADTVGENPFAPDCYLVDLPGYGFANASVEVKARWGKMIEKYLQTSRQLKTVFLLVDIRHEPSANDRQMLDWIRFNNLPVVIIATKKDKLKRSQIPKALKTIRTGLGVTTAVPIVPFSAETREGLEDIWAIIAGFASEETGAGEGMG